MTNYAMYHQRTARAGSYEYARGPMPGETYVDEDNSRLFYKIPRGQRRGFRAWYANAHRGLSVYRVTGAYRTGYQASRQ